MYKKAIILGILLLLEPSICAAEPIELTASWYSIQSLKDEGTYKTSKGVMSNGEKFNELSNTCAIYGYPFGTRLRITSLESGKNVVVVVTDRTAKRFTGKRIDLSRQSFIALVGSERGLEKGLIKVTVEVING